MLENRGVTQILVVLTVLALAGCGKMGVDSHAKAAKDVVAELQTVSDAIAGVTDKSSAESAGQKINAAADNIDGIAQRIKKLPQATKEENEAIHADVQPQLTAIKSQMDASLARLRDNHEVMNALEGPMMRMQMSLMGIEGAIVFGGSSQRTPPPFAAPPPGMARPGAPGVPPNMNRAMANARQRSQELRQNFASKFSADKIVTVEITPGASAAVGTRLYQHTMKLANVENAISEVSSGKMTIQLAPIDDPAALAAKIDFGKATLDGATRTIHVEPDAAKLANPPTDW